MSTTGTVSANWRAELCRPTPMLSHPRKSSPRHRWSQQRHLGRNSKALGFVSELLLPHRSAHQEIHKNHQPNKKPRICGAFLSGRRDSNSGPHQPELRVASPPPRSSPCKSAALREVGMLAKGGAVSAHLFSRNSVYQRPLQHRRAACTSWATSAAAAPGRASGCCIKIQVTAR
jgi:hypothetical protein